ncbi:hypothetical protein [Ulvibacterium sp.]|uniref:hypothetical protein n=1 Tax=Ulvibacterium sp. TaxID=2665914 RepID=UPI00262F7970|nr:hypothetical protein [Ulvibacterium sp.]
MKKVVFYVLFLVTNYSFSQNSFLSKLEEWFEKHSFSVRNTFDGSKNEQKPASIFFRENHKSDNDFLNVDLAFKISEFELFVNKPMALIIYPKVEWHKSTDTTDIKDKLDGGINLEWIPFALKSPDLDEALDNPGVKLSPYFQGISSFKRNFIDNVYETKLSGNISFVSNYKFMPGSDFRNNNDDFLGRYYPYLGVEYNRIPDLLVDGEVEEFTTYFFRVFIESWVIPQDLQLNLDYTFRRNLSSGSDIRKSLPVFILSLNYYPGNQESVGLGYEYKNGYDNEGRYNLIETSSLKLNVKF